MSRTIEGVPESITREQYVRLVKAAGFDPSAVVSLEFHVDGIHAVVKERIDGRDILLEGCNDVVKNRVYIPVVG